MPTVTITRRSNRALRPVDQQDLDNSAKNELKIKSPPKSKPRSGSQSSSASSDCCSLSSDSSSDQFIIADHDDENDYHRSEKEVGESLVKSEDAAEVEQLNKPFVAQIVWRNVFTMLLLHGLGFYGWYWCIRYGKWQTFVWAYFIGNLSGLGVLAGAHRLWTHRSYKAHWSVRVLLMLLQTLALQNDIYEWVRDHRAHHKYSETDADPHNSKRGFFFAHVGWLLCRKHPLVKEKGSQIDMSDVWADPIVRFQRRFYVPLVLLVWGVFPVVVPAYCWGEPWIFVVFGNFFRYVVSLHQAWLVNSAAHISGHQFYDKGLEPRENQWVTYLSMGEGYHNYHHTFPWDYSASEHGWKDCFNVATAFIDMFAAMGLVWDRRVVSRPVIEARIARTGDRSIMPPDMTADRKPTNLAKDIVMGLVVTSWSMWLSAVLRLFV